MWETACEMNGLDGRTGRRSPTLHVIACIYDGTVPVLEGYTMASSGCIV